MRSRQPNHSRSQPQNLRNPERTRHPRPLKVAAHNCRYLGSQVGSSVKFALKSRLLRDGTIRASTLMRMLKITILDSAQELRFRLEGRLAGPWVNELRQCWQTAESTTSGRRTVADLQDVDFIDDQGQSLLAEMHRKGVQLEAVTPLIQALVQECKIRCGTVEEKPARSKNALVCSDTPGFDPRAV